MNYINGVPDCVLHWEAYDRLYYEGDYDSLIRLQKNYMRANPGNPRDELMLADAYGYAGRHKAALRILKKLHRFDPYDSEYVKGLVECLRLCGTDPRAYKWARDVPFFETAQETADWCHGWLERKKSPEETCHLLTEMYQIGYVSYDLEALEEVLKEDGRFWLREPEPYGPVEVFLTSWERGQTI